MGVTSAVRARDRALTFTQPSARASNEEGDHKLKARVVAQWLLSVRADLPEDERRVIMELVLATYRAICGRPRTGRLPMADHDLPVDDELRIDAWCGEAPRGSLDANSLGWGMLRTLPEARQDLGPTPVDLAKWSDPRVGWGIVLPIRTTCPSPKRSRVSMRQSRFANSSPDDPARRSCVGDARSRLVAFAATPKTGKPQTCGSRACVAPAPMRSHGIS